MEITLDTIIALLGLFIGGGGGAFFTWRWQRKKAKAEAKTAEADAAKELQDVYQQLGQDIKTDRDEQKAYIQELNRTRINIVQVYLCQKRYAECEALDGQCLSEAEALYAKYGEGYLPTYLYAQCNHGELLLAQGKTEQALEIWRRVNQLMPNYVEQNPGTTFPAALKEKGVIK